MSAVRECRFFTITSTQSVLILSCNLNQNEMDLPIATEMELLFKEEVKLLDVVEYGFSLQDLVDGRKPVPAEGARFDISFEGRLEGHRINGKITGTDYLEVRPDRRFFLTLKGRIQTGDGANIQVSETGNNVQGSLSLHMKFHTSHSSYSWLNHREVLGLGYADLQSGSARVNAYLI